MIRRRYTDDEERRLRLRAAVAEWHKAGLVDAQQAATLDAQLRTDLKRTNDLLRAALGFFTFLVTVAAISFVLITFDIQRNETATAIALAFAAAVCFAAADLLVRSGRLYRYGVEESLVVVAVVCASFSTWMLTRDPRRFGPDVAPVVIGAAAAFIVYRRFGFVYAGIAAMGFAAFVPTQLGLGDHIARTGVALMFVAMFAVARSLRLRHGDEFPGDEYALLQAAACAGAYLTINLQIFGPTAAWGFRTTAPRDGFYWATYAATWIVPAIALTLAIRGKDRQLLAVGLVEAGITLATNKPYLGMVHQSWDPILFGLLLVSVALVVKRWLASGADGQRRGYTADRIAARDRELLAVVSNLSVAIPARAPGNADRTPEPSPFAGGRSGGGGGGASY